MLREETVEPATLELLKNLLALPGLKQFRLAGGAALCMMYGHRKAGSLDFFTDTLLDKTLLTETLRDNFESVVALPYNHPFACRFIIETVNVDFVYLKNRFQYPAQVINGIAIADIKDLIALKLNAIKGRGTKKDFFDVAKILQFYTLIDLFHIYNNRYHYDDTFALSRAMHNFNAVDDDIDPVTLDKTTWLQVKKTIKKTFDNYYKHI